MVDNICLVADYAYPAHVQPHAPEPFRWQKLLFKPVYAKGTEVFAIRYDADYRGLRFSMNGTNLTIAKSLHKFYKGNNYSDFTISELCESITMIEELTQLKAMHFKVKLLEFGINIVPITNVTAVLESLQVFKFKYSYELMKSKTMIYGKRYILTEYMIKVYDKAKQVKILDRLTLNQNLLRIEVVYMKGRAIPGIDTLEDLCDSKKLEGLSAKLLSYFNHMRMDDRKDFSKTDSRGRELFYAGGNPEFWATERRTGADHGKEKKLRYKKVCSDVLSSSDKQDLIEKASTKLLDLLGS